jgi:lysophospholipase
LAEPDFRPLILTAADGVALRAARWSADERGARGLALVLQGRAEFLEKYRPVAAELLARGFDVATLDWRGQGGSARALPDPRKGHVDDFAEYGRDLDAVLAQVGRPVLALAHSMGGCIALRALIEGRLAPRAMVFIAPMWGLPLGRFGGRLTDMGARALARTLTRMGLARRYAPGQGPTPYPLTYPERCLLTSDRDQAARFADLTLRHPALAIGGPTVGWVRAAFAEMDALVPLPTGAPALVALGTDERLISPLAIRARAARDGLSLVEIPGARHEPLFETPAARAALWAAVDAHLAARGV